MVAFCNSILTSDASVFCMQCRGGLVVRPRLWVRRVPGSKPDSSEDPSCFGPVAEAWRGVRQLKCRPHHLTAVQNYEVRLKTALLLL
ncbi:hypothetical protein AVEN_58388-1 [Araneus ventricosus]|uniref:Uncharacterized protein n=1 Tax=Araneus ventricosus TaxID=182803 RepID=A0A4Y2IA08_ARAVE|nr:hypothetical protein AVEN_58388-1 [Araneus ventricosus]